MQDKPRSSDATSVVGRTGFREHELREISLGEIHARPFQSVQTPRRVIHYAFTTDGDGSRIAREDLERLCRNADVAPPRPSDSHHIVSFGEARLRWETHSEFTTYTWDFDPPESEVSPSFDVLFGGHFDQPGPLIVATRLDLVKGDRDIVELLGGLDPGTTAVSAMRDGRAVGATDFQENADGMTRILVVDRGLYSHEVGPVVIRLIELETYRTMALFGLPEARRLQPMIARVEVALQEATTRIGLAPDLAENRALLESLTKLAGDLEASVAKSAFRFAATRAYNDIVQNRMGAVRETALEGYTRWSSFLQRRMGPAMRTCWGVESRLREVSDRLARAANLLRTRIEVDLEQQNRELLASMNSRARLQLRLQQWVEGLSVAAVSYYIVSLVYYLANGVDSLGSGLNPAGITALAIPPVVLGIWFFVRSVRARGHADEAAEDHPAS